MDSICFALFFVFFSLSLLFTNKNDLDAYTYSYSIVFDLMEAEWSVLAIALCHSTVQIGFILVRG